jgi:prepilin-type N-terminal cleavage/methylation domain-containing protein
MMTRSLGIGDGRKGFTILEIVMVLAITLLLIGAATPALTGMLKAEQLKAPARMLEAMAITARCNALAEQRPYQIIIEPDGFRLERPADLAGKEPLASFKLSKDIEFEMAGWPDETWSKPKRHVWYFAPSGLCEPIRVMFRKGESYFSQNYSPVTGWDQDESFFIR